MIREIKLYIIGVLIPILSILLYACNNGDETLPNNATTNSMFSMPYLQWGASSSEVKKYESIRRKELESLDTLLVFEDINGEDKTKVCYQFEDDSLYCVAIVSKKNDEWSQIKDELVQDLSLTELNDDGETYVDNAQLTLTVICEGLETVSLAWVAIEQPSIKENVYRGTLNGHEWVDLGLSVKWATCNIDASSPEKYGSYYQWGETTPSYSFWWSDYKYWYDKNGDGYFWRDELTYLKKDISGTVWDAARYDWGKPWRMPTQNELKELIDNCKFVKDTLNGVDCAKVTGPNGLSIFLPYGSKKYQNQKADVGEDCCLWSSTNCDTDHAYYLSGFKYWRIFDTALFTGMPIRPVTE